MRDENQKGKRALIQARKARKAVLEQVTTPLQARQAGNIARMGTPETDSSVPYGPSSPSLVEPDVVVRLDPWPLGVAVAPLVWLDAPITGGRVRRLHLYGRTLLRMISGLLAAQSLSPPCHPNARQVSLDPSLAQSAAFLSSR